MRNAIAAAAVASSALFFLAPAARAEGTLVELHSDSSVQLEARESPTDAWRVVCAHACDEKLATSASYRVTGDAIRDSNVFKLDPSGDRAHVKVDARSRGAFTAGVVLTTIGSIFLTSAIVVPIVNAATPATNQVNIVGVLVGAIGTLVGVSTLVPGVFLMAHNGSSRVTQE